MTHLCESPEPEGHGNLFVHDAMVPTAEAKVLELQGPGHSRSTSQGPVAATSVVSHISGDIYGVRNSFKARNRDVTYGGPDAPHLCSNWMTARQQLKTVMAVRFFRVFTKRFKRAACLTFSYHREKNLFEWWIVAFVERSCSWVRAFAFQDWKHRFFSAAL